LRLDWGPGGLAEIVTAKLGWVVEVRVRMPLRKRLFSWGVIRSCAAPKLELNVLVTSMNDVRDTYIGAAVGGGLR